MTDEDKRAWLRPIVSTGLQSARQPYIDSSRPYYPEQEEGVIDALIKSGLTHELFETINALKAENAALRSAVQYLIDDGAADCCAKCVYCPQPTEEDDDCDCLHKGDCVDGMIKWFEGQRKELPRGKQ